MEDVNPCAVSLASVELQHWYDSSGVAEVPARSPDSPESPVLAEALLVGAAPVLTDPPQWQPVVLPTWQSQLDYHDDAQPPQSQL